MGEQLAEWLRLDAAEMEHHDAVLTEADACRWGGVGALLWAMHVREAADIVELHQGMARVTFEGRTKPYITGRAMNRYDGDVIVNRRAIENLCQRKRDLVERHQALLDAIGDADELRALGPDPGDMADALVRIAEAVEVSRG